MGEAVEVVRVAIVQVRVEACDVGVWGGFGGEGCSTARGQLGGKGGTAVGVQGVVQARDVM